jgi:hypothetical protein
MGPHPIIQSILEAHGAPKSAVRPDLADDVRHIAAHEPDPRKEDVLYEAADALEASGETATRDRIKVVFVCGDPAIFIGNQHIAKVARSSPEGEALTAWAKARWDAERGEGVEA